MAQSDGHDAPGLIDELVPRHTAVVDEIVVRFEDTVRQPVVAQELPDVFDRIELGTFRRQRHNGDVWWHDESRRQVPAGLIDQEYGVAPGATVAAISTRCRFIASVLQVGRIRAAPLPCFGQTAPKM